MLFKTGLMFRIGYFFTAFFPSLILAIVSNTKLSHSKLFGITYQNCMILLLMLIVMVSAIGLKHYFSYKTSEGEDTNFWINFDLKSADEIIVRDEEQIFETSDNVQINGGSIQFIFSTLAPSLLTNIAKADIVYSFLFTMILFLLLMWSSDPFPNVILILAGVCQFKTSGNITVFFLRKNSGNLTDIRRLKYLGQSQLNKTFILGYEKHDKKTK